MQIKMADLPGIGKRISLITAEQSMMVIIVHHSGKRELYFFEDAEADEADFKLNLTGDETREMGAQLLGATYQPVDLDTMKIFKKQIVMEWVELKKSSPIIGKTLGESQIRKITGASIIGVVRGDNVIVSPEIDFVFQADDTLMAVGKSDQIGAFESLCAGEEVS